MNYPIFSLAVGSADVLALLKKGNTTRFYPFGEAPQGIERPYAVWQLVGGQPENRLATAPSMDTFRIQVDVYADKQSEARAVGDALRDAFEPAGYITGWNFEGRESDTRLFRFSFTVEFMEPRVVSS